MTRNGSSRRRGRRLRRERRRRRRALRLSAARPSFASPDRFPFRLPRRRPRPQIRSGGCGVPLPACHPRGVLPRRLFQPVRALPLLRSARAAFHRRRNACPAPRRARARASSTPPRAPRAISAPSAPPPPPGSSSRATRRRGPRARPRAAREGTRTRLGSRTTRRVARPTRATPRPSPRPSISDDAASASRAAADAAASSRSRSASRRAASSRARLASSASRRALFARDVSRARSSRRLAISSPELAPEPPATGAFFGFRRFLPKTFGNDGGGVSRRERLLRSKLRASHPFLQRRARRLGDSARAPCRRARSPPRRRGARARAALRISAISRAAPLGRSRPPPRARLGEPRGDGLELASESRSTASRAVAVSGRAEPEAVVSAGLGVRRRRPFRDPPNIQRRSRRALRRGYRRTLSDELSASFAPFAARRAPSGSHASSSRVRARRRPPPRASRAFARASRPPPPAPRGSGGRRVLARRRASSRSSSSRFARSGRPSLAVAVDAPGSGLPRAERVGPASSRSAASIVGGGFVDASWFELGPAEDGSCPRASGRGLSVPARPARVAQ